MPWVEFLRWIWRGKSARRALLNIELIRRAAVKGRVLDVGGKGKPSYQEVLPGINKTAWVVLDIMPGEGVSVRGDLAFQPFKKEMFDFVICFNVLEHVYDFRAALGEMRRVLKPYGILYGYVPFICNVHADPSDYWRFTGDCLKRSLNEAGYSVDIVVPQGGVFISCFDLASFVVKRVLPLRVLLAALLLTADGVLNRIRPSFADHFPVGYFFIGRKAEMGQ